MDTSLDLEGLFGAQEQSSQAMQLAVGDWFSRYYDGGLLKLPFTVVRKLVRAVFAEYEAQGALAALPARKAMELALIGGESFLRPVFLDGWQWQVIPRSGILIFERDLLGRPVDVGLAEQRQEGRLRYTLLERRTVTGGQLVVTHRLFCATDGGKAREVSLRACKAYAELPQRQEFAGISSVGLARLRTPMTNCIDGSAEAVSIFAPAVDLMDALEENETQLRQEFTNGASRLVVSRDMLRDGQLRDKLFVALDESPDTVGITVFSPQLRQESFLQRQQAYLRLVENVLGLKRGLLGEVEAAPRTATEITSTEGEYLTTLLELRRCFETAAQEAMTLLWQLGEPEEPVQLHWGDNLV